MHIEKMTENAIILHGKNWRILFSYETPVAIQNIMFGEIEKTSKKHSNTTSRHINFFIKTYAHVGKIVPVQEVQQIFIDNFVETLF